MPRNYLLSLHEQIQVAFQLIINTLNQHKKVYCAMGTPKISVLTLLQYRQLLATLDPVGMPLISATLGGNGADDPLYLPTWQKMVKVIGHKDFVLIADCKASSIATRAQIAANGGVYCFPVSMNGQHPLYLKQWVLDPPAESLEICLPRQDEDEPAVGRGLEVELGKFWLNPETNKWVRWHERYLVVYSHRE